LEWLCRPNVIAIEGDVFPAEWSDMREQIIAEHFTLRTQFIDRAAEIDGVPEDYGRDGEIETESPVSLIFEGPITDFTDGERTPL
jgi:hypothetical protein